MSEAAPVTPTTSHGPPSPQPAEPGTGTSPGDRLARWPFVVLGLALLWVVLIRIPLILNAETHLDSDLAVDGITLRDTLHGQFRWHYPGTPHSGILPVLYSLPQAAVFGATPRTLVSGGTVAFALLVAATFALGWVAFGRDVAVWGLVPLTFASTGAIWLSGRITGGHLSAALWHAVAFLLFYLCLARGSWKYPLALGVWSGLGVYVDYMFVLTLVGIVPAAVVHWFLSGRSKSGLVGAAVFLAGLPIGLLPREIGSRVDPYSAYPAQFVPFFQAHVLRNHFQLLVLDCLPRLIVGHRLPDLQSDPDPTALGGPAPTRGPRDRSPVAILTTALVIVLFLAAVRAIGDPASAPGDRAASAIRWALMISALATFVAFVINLNIFNSDNYRYLATLLVAWSIGFGLAMRAMVRAGRAGLVSAALCSLAMAGMLTLDTARWYHRFHWVDDRGRPISTVVEDPVVAWLNEHPEVRRFQGGYWDVYRVTFLAKHPVRGIPFRMFPNRYPEWSSDLGEDGHTDVVVGRRYQGSRAFVDRALLEGGQYLARGAGYVIVSWPERKDNR